MSKGFYFKIKRLGLGPRETWVLGRVQITPQDEAAWQRRHAAPRTTEDRLRQKEQAEWRSNRARRAVAVALRNPEFRGSRRYKPAAKTRRTTTTRSAPP